MMMQSMQQAQKGGNEISNKKTNSETQELHLVLSQMNNV